MYSIPYFPTSKRFVDSVHSLGVALQTNGARPYSIKMSRVSLQVLHDLLASLQRSTPY